MSSRPRRNDLELVTTTLGTPWESFSQSLLATGFPASRRRLVDGRAAWSPLGFLPASLAGDARWIVHVDEDCFLLDPAQLDALLEELDSEPETLVCGTPDGGTFHRDHNPYACNPFFLILRRRELAELLASDPDWPTRRWSGELAARANPPLADLDAARIQLDDFEAYYSLFWAVLAAGARIRYLLPGLDRGLFASELRFDATGNRRRPMALHMWWLRSAASPLVEPYLGVDHRSRYERLRPILDRALDETPGGRALYRRLDRQRRLRSLRRTVIDLARRALRRRR